LYTGEARWCSDGYLFSYVQISVVYIRNTLRPGTGAKRRARAKYTESSDPMIEAGAPSTVGAVQGVLRTEGSHGLTTNGPAQPFKGAKRRAALQEVGKARPRAV
jgi:hypothetical protein